MGSIPIPNVAASNSRAERLRQPASVLNLLVHNYWVWTSATTFVVGIKNMDNHFFGHDISLFG